MTATTEPATTLPASPVRRWDSDGACRCSALLNVWGGRTTHYRSQCHPDEQSATPPDRRADR